MGAKCSTVLVETPDLKVLIDPGAAEMQPSYPMSWEDKLMHLAEARERIEAASEGVDVVVISHYHYDHHSPLDTAGMRAERLYRGRIIYAKNPNTYINESQWGRAREFFAQLYRELGGVELREVLIEPGAERFPDPLDELPLSRSRDWGSYAERKKALLEKGRSWFRRLVERFWAVKPWVPALKLREVEVRWADGARMVKGGTELRFSKPRFHGLEFDRVGWVVSTTISYRGWRLHHTSDLEGVPIEDYVEEIVAEDPDVLIVDGPPTYLYGFMVNRINLKRAVDSLKAIVSRVDAEVIILDHHLLREPRYRERLREVYEEAERRRRQVLTAAEYLGGRPKILELAAKGR